MRKIIWLFVVSFLMIAMFSCDSDSGNAKVQVWLTDAPGDYEEVNVEIVGVEVHTAEGEQGSGWKSIPVKSGVYDLLKLTNGLDTLLGTLEMPAGRISQLRLKLGAGNSLKIGGASHVLATPSGQQSGLKIQVHQVLSEGITYKILLDFDVARSIVNQGNGSYSLKPVIRSITEAQDGAIKGRVSPAESTPAVFAILGTDTVGSVYTDEMGRFLIRGLAPGSYTVGFSPNTDFQELVKENVTVNLGSVTDLGEVQLQP